MTKKYKPETIALHAAYNPKENQNSRAVPIYATSSYVFESSQHAADLFALKTSGYIYTRLNNPTNNVLEERLAAYHGASAAISFSSGSAANAFLIMQLAEPGKNLIASPYLYGGTHNLLTHTLKQWGVTTKFVDLNDSEALKNAIDDNTVMVFGETIANPGGQILDLESIAKISHDAGLPLVVDNTSTPPPLINPLDYGADLLTYSLTKLIGGHGQNLGGILVEKGDFDWGKSGRFNKIDGPDDSYGGLNFWQALGADNFKQQKSQVICLKLRTGLLRDIGPTLSPHAAAQFITSLETLPLRAEKHVENALIAAKFLNTHPNVSWVTYPGLTDNAYHNLAVKYFKKSPGAVFSFGLKGGYEAAKKFIDQAPLFSNLANILDSRTLIIHPASTTHQQLTSKARAQAGVPDDMIRISIGLENSEDILSALQEALK